jgi:hypothetical protein
MKRIAQLEKAAGHLNTGGPLLISHQRKMAAPDQEEQAGGA